MDEITKKVIGTRINTALALRNVKQKDLAQHLEVPDNTISYFVSGRRVPNMEQLIKISKFLNVSTDYLLSVTDVVSTDVEIRNIRDYTGLNENALSLAHYFKEQCDLHQENKALFNVMGAYFDVINFIMNIKQYDFNFIAFLGRYKLTLKEQTEKLKELTNSYLECLKNNTYHNRPSYLLEEDEVIEEKVGYKKYLIEDGFKKFIDEYARDELELYKTALESLKSVLDEYDYSYYKEGNIDANDNETE